MQQGAGRSVYTLWGGGAPPRIERHDLGVRLHPLARRLVVGHAVVGPPDGRTVPVDAPARAGEGAQGAVLLDRLPRVESLVGASRPLRASGQVLLHGEVEAAVAHVRPGPFHGGVLDGGGARVAHVLFHVEVHAGRPAGQSAPHGLRKVVRPHRIASRQGVVIKRLARVAADGAPLELHGHFGVWSHAVRRDGVVGDSERVAGDGEHLTEDRDPPEVQSREEVPHRGQGALPHKHVEKRVECRHVRNREDLFDFVIHRDEVHGARVRLVANLLPRDVEELHRHAAVVLRQRAALDHRLRVWEGLVVSVGEADEGGEGGVLVLKQAHVAPAGRHLHHKGRVEARGALCMHPPPLHGVAVPRVGLVVPPPVGFHRRLNGIHLDIFPQAAVLLPRPLALAVWVHGRSP
mmetsp:Transcript_24195/g.76082  ORF Transcript_24195/g.76082 Transcript_24195/m.76082 type:complete len:405 (+) Transcript_24195:310-1524(+)